MGVVRPLCRSVFVYVPVGEVPAWTQIKEGVGSSAGWGLQRFPGRALSYSSFSSCRSVNRQWLNGDEKGAGEGRTETRPRMKTVPLSSFFVFGCHLKHTKANGSPHWSHNWNSPVLYYDDKPCDLLRTHRLGLCFCCRMFIRPTPTTAKNNKDFTGGTAVFSSQTHLLL